MWRSKFGAVAQWQVCLIVYQKDEGSTPFSVATDWGRKSHDRWQHVRFPVWASVVIQRTPEERKNLVRFQNTGLLLFIRVEAMGTTVNRVEKVRFLPDEPYGRRSTASSCLQNSLIVGSTPSVRAMWWLRQRTPFPENDQSAASQNSVCSLEERHLAWNQDDAGSNPAALTTYLTVV